MANAGQSQPDLTPVICTSYCYVCNARIFTEQPEDWHLPGYHDFQPVTCGASNCLKHFETVVQAQLPPREAPYLTSVTYDGGSFLEFANRNQRPEIIEQPPGPIERLIPYEYLFENIPKLEPLFQAWFFFGLLEEFLGPLFRKEDFLTANGEKITTEQLQHVLKLWVLEATESKDTKPIDHAHLFECLFYVQRVFMCVYPRHLFNDDLTLVIDVTMNSLGAAIYVLFPELEYKSVSIVFAPQSLLDDFTDRGWCPYEANTLLQQPGTSPKMLFYSQLGNRNSRYQHVDCNPESCCLIRNSSTSTVEPLHRTQPCSCEEVGPNDSQMESIRNLLYQEKLPVLRLNKDDNDKVTVSEVIEASSDTPYVALSHVWKHGLGNPIANQIHQCQWNQLYKYIESLTAVVDPEAVSQPLCLWLDTICCPVFPEAARQAGILLMRETYSQALCALVLDNDLLSLETERLSVLELSFRIHLTTWTKRLWTLQEGALPPTLWIQFKDRAVNIKSLWLALREILRRPDPVCATLAGEAVASLIGLRLFSGDYKNELYKLTSRIMAMIGDTLAVRSVTKPNDEPLCITAVLGLDIRKLLQSPEEERMKTLWHLMSDQNLLRKDLLFYEGFKFSTPGYRWAPSTLLQTGSRLGLTYHRDNPDVANITPRGLRFISAGMIVHVPGSPYGLNSEGWDLHSDVGLSQSCAWLTKSSTLNEMSAPCVQDMDGQWLYMANIKFLSWRETSESPDQDSQTVWEILSFSKADYALLPRYSGPHFQNSKPNIFILARIESLEQEVVCYSLFQAVLSPLSASANRILSYATATADAIRKDLGDNDPEDEEQVHQALSEAVESHLSQINDTLKEADRICVAAWQWTAEEKQAYIREVSNFQEDLVTIGGTDGIRRVLQYAVAGRYVRVIDHLPASQSWIFS